MRSIFGRARVTQTVRPCASRGGSFAAGTSGSLAAFQPSKPPSSASAATPACRSQAAAPCAELLAALADDDGRAAGEFLAPVGGVLMAAPDRAGNQPRIGGKILVGADVDQGRGLRRADQAGKFV